MPAMARVRNRAGYGVFKVEEWGRPAGVRAAAATARPVRLPRCHHLRIGWHGQGSSTWAR